MTTKNPTITNEHHDYTYSPCASWEYDGAQGSMRYALGHWCLHYGSAAQWVDSSGNDSALSAVHRAIRTGEMGHLLEMVQGVRWADTGAHRTKEASIDGRVIARVTQWCAAYEVRLFGTPRKGPGVKIARDLSVAERMVYDHAAQPGVADPYAYLDGLENAAA